MKIYSTGEAAGIIGVTRDSLFAALKKGAPDAQFRMGGRRVFTEEEVSRLAAWYEERRRRRDGWVRPEERRGGNV